MASTDERHFQERSNPDLLEDISLEIFPEIRGIRDASSAEERDSFVLALRRRLSQQVK
jgi:hypothetical protein